MVISTDEVAEDDADHDDQAIRAAERSWHMDGFQGLSDITVHGAFLGKRDGEAGDDDEAAAGEEQEATREVRDEVISLVETGCTVAELQEFVEAKLVTGLRRMAGIHAFNHILTRAGDGDEAATP